MLALRYRISGDECKLGLGPTNIVCGLENPCRDIVQALIPGGDGCKVPLLFGRLISTAQIGRISEDVYLRQSVIRADRKPIGGDRIALADLAGSSQSRV